MAFRKERDRLKEIDSELTRIKKDLLHIDKSLKSLNKIPPPSEEPIKAEKVSKKKEPVNDEAKLLPEKKKKGRKPSPKPRMKSK